MLLRDAIVTRRTIRDFKPDPIPLHILTNILQDAAWAPNHRMKEPWKLYLFLEDAREIYLHEMIESYIRTGITAGYTEEEQAKMKERLHRFVMTIPVHLIIAMERDENPIRYEEDYAAVCSYTQNVQLLAWERGIGTLWSSSGYRFDERFHSQMGLTAEEKIIAVLHMGYPESVPEAKQRSDIQTKLTVRTSRFHQLEGN